MNNISAAYIQDKILEKHNIHPVNTIKETPHSKIEKEFSDNPFAKQYPSYSKVQELALLNLKEQNKGEKSAFRRTQQEHKKHISVLTAETRKKALEQKINLKKEIDDKLTRGLQLTVEEQNLRPYLNLTLDEEKEAISLGIIPSKTVQGIEKVLPQNNKAKELLNNSDELRKINNKINKYDMKINDLNSKRSVVDQQFNGLSELKYDLENDQIISLRTNLSANEAAKRDILKKKPTNYQREIKEVINPRIEELKERIKYLEPYAINNQTKMDTLKKIDSHFNSINELKMSIGNDILKIQNKKNALVKKFDELVAKNAEIEKEIKGSGFKQLGNDEYSLSYDFNSRPRVMPYDLINRYDAEIAGYEYFLEDESITEFDILKIKNIINRLRKDRDTLIRQYLGEKSPLNYHYNQVYPGYVQGEFNVGEYMYGVDTGNTRYDFPYMYRNWGGSNWPTSNQEPYQYISLPDPETDVQLIEHEVGDARYTPKPKCYATGTNSMLKRLKMI